MPSCEKIPSYSSVTDPAKMTTYRPPLQPLDPNSTALNEPSFTSKAHFHSTSDFKNYQKQHSTSTSQNASSSTSTAPQYQNKSIFIPTEQLRACASPDIESLYVYQRADNETRYVRGFAKEISQMFFERELKDRCDALYMQNQPLTTDMRCILTDWLVSVHFHFRLLPETFYLAINLLDRFCSKERVSKDRYQLLGTACLLVAAKYEELFPPRIERFVRVGAGAFSKEQLLEMEKTILVVLDYVLTVVTPFQFLKRFLVCACADEDTQYLACYFAELSSVHFEMIQFKPSDQAAACVHMAQLFAATKHDAWDDRMVYYSRMQNTDFRDATETLYALLRKEEDTRFDAAKNKYQRKESRNGVAHLVQQRLRAVGRQLNLI